MLKGYSATALLPDLLPLIGLAVIVIGVGLKSALLNKSDFG